LPLDPIGDFSPADSLWKIRASTPRTPLEAQLRVLDRDGAMHHEEYSRSAIVSLIVVAIEQTACPDVFGQTFRPTQVATSVAKYTLNSILGFVQVFKRKFEYEKPLSYFWNICLLILRIKFVGLLLFVDHYMGWGTLNVP